MVTIYDFAKYCMEDEEFNKGGIPTNERWWLDNLGLKYETDKYGNICGGEDDMAKFYYAMVALQELNKLYIDKCANK